MQIKLSKKNILILVMLVFASAVAMAESKSAVENVKGSLSVMVLGSGGPIATSEGRASAGYLIFTDGKPRILMDVGGGTYQRVAKSGVNIKDLDIVLLSHLHIDHTGDLSAVLKTIYFHNNLAGSGRTKAVHIYGSGGNGVNFPPPADGVAQYPSTTDYVDAHYAMPGGVERYLNVFASAISEGASKFSYMAHDLNSTVPGAMEEEVLSTEDGLRITAIAVDHGPTPAVAFRIEYKGNSIVYSGDTGSNGPNMITISRDADLLIYDTAITDDLPLNPLFHKIHTSPTRLGEVAAAANVEKLLLSHITPVTSSRLKEVIAVLRDMGYKGKIKKAKDLKVINFK